MVAWIRWLVPLAVAAVLALSAIVAFGKTSPGGPLTGTWSGYIAGKGSEAKRQHIRIVVNAKESAGSW